MAALRAITKACGGVRDECVNDPDGSGMVAVLKVVLCTVVTQMPSLRRPRITIHQKY